MGLLFSSLFDRFKTERRIVMLGLDGAGKSTILYKLKLGEVVHTIPTIGFNVETVDYKKVSMTVWDVGGQKKLRGLWRHYYEGTHGLIFVVDSMDKDRLASAQEELQHILADPHMRDATVLVYANKQDLPGAMPPSEIASGLGLSDMKSHKWYIQGTCGVTGDGLYDGLDWLTEDLKKSA